MQEQRQKLLKAALERFKAKAKQPSKADHAWINFGRAVVEVSEALSLPSEVAQMTLFGLIATGEIRASDKKDVIDLDRCTIAELSKLSFIAADQLREWLRQHSTAPLSDRERVIAEMLQGGIVPGSGGNTNWNSFHKNLCDSLNAWHGKGAKRRPTISLKTIQRDVEKLRKR